jgi:SAM-dependent methyltransferase
MEWIAAVWQPARPSPSRILVAGCGTGAEAFSLSRRFPHSKIVAADFSPRSVAVATDLQRRMPAMKNIHFMVGDLTMQKFARTAERGFDFITCHGVLSYIENPVSFHRAVFMAQPEALPPWDNPDKLPAWRPVVTPALREHRWPTRRRAWHTLRNLKIKSPATNTLIELSLPEWVLEILRGCDGTRPLRAILSKRPLRPITPGSAANSTCFTSSHW